MFWGCFVFWFRMYSHKESSCLFVFIRQWRSTLQYLVYPVRQGRPRLPTKLFHPQLQHLHKHCQHIASIERSGHSEIRVFNIGEVGNGGVGLRGTRRFEVSWHGVGQLGWRADVENCDRQKLDMSHAHKRRWQNSQIINNILSLIHRKESGWLLRIIFLHYLLFRLHHVISFQPNGASSIMCYFNPIGVSYFPFMRQVNFLFHLRHCDLSYRSRRSTGSLPERPLLACQQGRRASWNAFAPPSHQMAHTEEAGARGSRQLSDWHMHAHRELC